MAQGEAVYPSFSNGEERAGVELPNPNELPEYVDSVDHYTPEQLPTSYDAMRSAIIEAAQASGELQPLTEAEMERRAQQEARIEHLLREARQAEIYAQNLSVEETHTALQELEGKTVPTFGFLYSPQGDMVAIDHSRFDSMNSADWRVVCCDVGGEPYEARVTDVCQLTRDTFGTTGLVPGGATARMVVTTTSEQGTTQYVIDCYEGRPPLVVAVETPIEGGDRTVAPYLEDWNQISAAPDGADVGSSDLPQGDNALVRAA